METIGYHTLEDRENPEEVTEKAPFPCNRGDAWLSSGYYYWDDDLEQAHRWGKGNYIICKSTISLDDIIDLHNKRNDQKYFIELLKIAKNFFKKKKIENVPIGKAVQYLRKLNKKKIGTFDYQGIRAADFPIQPRFKFVSTRPQYTYLHARIQICIFEEGRDAIKSLDIIHPEKYRS